ncbi:MAG: MinD/ParA family protein, partial [Coleofasciculus sp. S288]|nr:MinD/ParA family protein [Coleofasciculus sp. S288]
MPKVVSIHSYRGGTGKSNFTANLATSIALQGNRVGVVDTDVPSPGIHNLFCLDPEDTGKTLNNYLWSESSIEDVAYDVSRNIGLDGKGKLFLVPSSVKADDIARILKEGYDVKLLNDGFRKLVKSLQLDYLFIDTHPGLSKETFLTIAISHVLILILRPDKQDYQGTAVTIDVARQLNVRKMLLAINKALHSMNFDALRQKVEEAYSAPVAGIFPESEDMIQLASEGVFCV